MLWNQKDLPQPPVCTYKSSSQELDLTKLRHALQDGMKHFKNDFLITETAILSRILYRMKMKFRSSKDFKLMEILSRSLKIYFGTNMCRHLKNIFDVIPPKYQRETYLPTRNMLSYTLVRLQGLVKLMERMYETCISIATELNKKIYIGHFWKVLLVLFALISRISVLIKFNTKYLCELYGKLLPHSHKLQNIGKDWLPKGYVMPSDLRSWLDVQWVYEEEFVDLTYEPTNELMNFLNLVDDDDDDDVLFCDEYILLDDEDKRITNDFNKLSPIKETLKKNRFRGFSINEDDIGEEITNIIELDDTVNFQTEGEDLECEYALDSNSQSDDIGEEICMTTNNVTPTNLHNYRPTLLVENSDTLCNNSKQNEVPTLENRKILDLPISKEDRPADCNNYFNDNNDKDDDTVISIADQTLVLEENLAITIPDTPIEEKSNFTSCDEIIILNDTFDNEVLQPNTSANKVGQHLNESLNKLKKKNLNSIKSKKKGTKRKLEVDEIIPHKKLKKPAQSNVNLSVSPAKSKSVKNKKSRERKKKRLFRNENQIKANAANNGENVHKRWANETTNLSISNASSREDTLQCKSITGKEKKLNKNINNSNERKAQKSTQIAPSNKKRSSDEMNTSILDAILQEDTSEYNKQCKSITGKKKKVNKNINNSNERKRQKSTQIAPSNKKRSSNKMNTNILDAILKDDTSECNKSIITTPRKGKKKILNKNINNSNKINAQKSTQIAPLNKKRKRMFKKNQESLENNKEVETLKIGIPQTGSDHIVFAGKEISPKIFTKITYQNNSFKRKKMVQIGNDFPKEQKNNLNDKGLFKKNKASRKKGLPQSVHISNITKNTSKISQNKTPNSYETVSKKHNKNRKRQFRKRKRAQQKQRQSLGL